MKKNKKSRLKSRDDKKSYPFEDKKRFCHFSQKNSPVIDYKDIKLLSRYVSEKGKMTPSRITNVSSKKQKETNLTSSFKNIDPDVSLNYLKMLVGLENTNALENINCPITIIHGDKTFKSVYKSLIYYQKIWETPTIIELKKVGHLPIEEAPSEISKIIFNSKQN